MNRETAAKIRSNIIQITYKIVLVICVLKALMNYVEYGSRLNQMQSMDRTFKGFSMIFNAHVRDHPNESLPSIDDLKKNPDFYMDNSVFGDSSHLKNQRVNIDILYFAEGKPDDWLTADKIVAVQWIPIIRGKERASVLYGDGQIKSLDSSQWESLIAELILGHNPPRVFSTPSTRKTNP
jgi:hypothetical protein